MIPALVVLLYLGIVFYIGIFAFRRADHTHEAEDFFLAGRSLGPAIFLLSLFGTNMTAFAILGSSGHAFANGVVTFGLMASSSALIIPLSLLFIGTRVWALGKRYGFITPVQLFRDRWECGHIGTMITLLQAALLLPYIIISVMGGGTTLEVVSGGLVPYWLGGAVVAAVVMSYVFFGGMRGTAWVNTFQTSLFLVFGLITMAVIANGMGGFTEAVNRLASKAATAHLLTREKVSPLYFFSYTFIPLSSIAFPHITIFCLTARKMAQFKKTVIFYPLCMLLIWFPCVLLGVVANQATDVPAIAAKLEARQTLAAQGATLGAAEKQALRTRASGDDILPTLLGHYAPVWLAGLLGAGIMAAVMASDSQILALSTMAAEDLFAFYGGTRRFGEHVQVVTGRVFVVALTVVAYAIALRAPQSIFEIGVQYAFTGYSALFPLLVAALFWRGSTKWGALAATLWVGSAVAGIAVLQALVPPPAAGQSRVLLQLGDWELLTRTVAGTSVFGLLPVVPVTLISGFLVWIVSLWTRKPGDATLRRYFS